jgi:hypothetical protein
MRYFTLMILMAAVMLLPAAAYATPIIFVASLSGANENPVNMSPGTGFATVVLDAAAHTIQINAMFSNLTSNTVAAHIHCCIAPPNNTGVATTVPAFPGFPLGMTSGNYVSVVFDLTQALIYNPAFVTAQGGLPQAEAALVAGIMNGMTYFNIHTVNFQGGEIRGFLTPVPEPSSVVLLGTGLLGFILMRSRRLAARRG